MNLHYEKISKRPGVASPPQIHPRQVYNGLVSRLYESYITFYQDNIFYLL